jgi:hypothetical protein
MERIDDMHSTTALGNKGSRYAFDTRRRKEHARHSHFTEIMQKTKQLAIADGAIQAAGSATP